MTLYTYIHTCNFTSLCHTGQDLFYSCPAVRADTAGICEHECSLDSECTDSKKCCYNGCGHTCQPPVTIPYISLSEDTSCPSTNEVPCVDQEGGGSCRDPAFSCDEGEICCDNECSSAVCLSLNDLKPCLTAKVECNVHNYSVVYFRVYMYVFWGGGGTYSYGT